MTPETSDFLVAAERALSNARNILAIDIPDQAARLAYYAQFHAAQALIFERTAKISKTHKGVDKQFHKLVKAEPTLPSDLAGQLGGVLLQGRRQLRHRLSADHYAGLGSRCHCHSGGLRCGHSPLAPITALNLEPAIPAIDCVDDLHVFRNRAAHPEIHST